MPPARALAGALVLLAVSLPEMGTAAAQHPSRPAGGSPSPLARPIGCRERPGLYTHGPARKVVALSFDDGPAADTPAFVSMLERERVPATFFMIGDELSGADRGLLRRELLDGDALGDHTFTHPFLTRVSDPAVELSRTREAIAALSGYTPCVFRPPYGDIDARVERIAASLGLASVKWDVDPSDYARPGTAAIVQRVLAQVVPGSIVLSHDGGGPRGETLAAYPAIIRALRVRGYRFQTVPALLGFRPLYRRCRADCEGLGFPVSGLPPGAIVERG